LLSASFTEPKMKKLLLAAVATAAIAYPAYAQQQPQTQPATNQPAAQNQQREEIAPNDLSLQQVRNIQEVLKQKGFNPGEIDGVWGTHTTAALREFQTQRGMTASGQLDRQTMSALGLDATQFASSQKDETLGLGNSSGNNNKINLAAFREAKMGVEDAIAAVTNNGDVALDVRFDLRDGKPVYYVRTYSADKKTFWDGMVDANTGKVMGNGNTMPEDQLTQTDKNQLDALKGAKWSLEDAVKAAEDHSHADAINAWAIGGSKPHYEVIVDKNGSAQKITVDPMKAQVSSG
jgi:peptidoglycan hydrolase-like protein with peptidoglycan-binding domain